MANPGKVDLKRKRVAAPLPPMTIVTRSSARRKSTSSPLKETASHRAASTATNTTNATTSTTVNTRSLRTRAVHSHTNHFTASPQKTSVDNLSVSILPSKSKPVKPASKGSESTFRLQSRCSRNVEAEKVEPQVVPKQEDKEDMKVENIEVPESQNKKLRLSIRLPLKESQEETESSEVEDDQDEEEEEEEDLPTFKYEKTDNDVVEGGFELMQTDDLDSIVEVASPLFDNQSTNSSFENLADNRIYQSRWPLDEQDDSTTFSILVKSDENLSSRTSNQSPFHSTSPEPSSFPTILDTQSPLYVNDQESIEDFVDYESAGSLTEDDGNDSETMSGSSSPEITSPASLALPLPTLWTDKYASIPLCGYRNRNLIDFECAPPTAKRTKAIAAALSSMTMSFIPTDPLLDKPGAADAYYQQALIAATGLTQRSLLSGKAREMVGAGLMMNSDLLL